MVLFCISLIFKPTSINDHPLLYVCFCLCSKPLHLECDVFCRFFPAGIQTDSVLSARLQIIRIYIREDGRLVIEFKTHAKFRGQFCHPLPCSRCQEKSTVYNTLCLSLILPLFFCPSGQFVLEHHTLPGHKSHLMPPDHLGGIEFDIQLLWRAQSFDSPYQLWRATSSYSRSVNGNEDCALACCCTKC